MADSFADLPIFGFDIVVADPPWLYDLRSSNGIEKSPQKHYACMPLDAIKALPVGNLVGCPSWLFLWATAPMLPHALAVMCAWGFTYRTRLSWRKLTPSGKPRLGTGYVVRTLHEDILVGAMGSPPYLKALPSLFDGSVRSAVATQLDGLGRPSDEVRRGAAGVGMITALPNDRRFVGDPIVSSEPDRIACLYGAAMMRKVGRLPTDMATIDVHFVPPATLVFVAADGSQAEVGRYLIPDRVLTYDPKPRLMPPEDSRA